MYTDADRGVAALRRSRRVAVPIGPGDRRRLPAASSSSSRWPREHRRRRGPPGLRVPLRERRRSRGAIEARRPGVHRPDARADPPLRRQGRGPRRGRRRRACRSSAGPHAVRRRRRRGRGRGPRVGFPLLVKSVAGGGGIGMLACDDPASSPPPSTRRCSRARQAFGNPAVFLERLVANARHVEVQVFGDGAGTVVALGERDCSSQRRRQKVIEEAPAPGPRRRDRAPRCRRPRARCSNPSATARPGRSSSWSTSTRGDVPLPRGEHAPAGRARRHRGDHRHRPRRVDGARSRPATRRSSPTPRPRRPTRGHAIEARVYAEDPARGFVPSPGLVTEAPGRADVRVDTWVRDGTEVTPYYDPLLAKIVVHAPTRAEARRRVARRAARDDGRTASRPTATCSRRSSRRRRSSSGDGRRPPPSSAHRFRAPHHRRARARAATTVQDLPGRLGYWHVGVPPSGPMDDRSFRARQPRSLGNPEGAPGLECTAAGPDAAFRHARRRSASPAREADATLDGDAGAVRGRRSSCPRAARSRSARRIGPGSAHLPARPRRRRRPRGARVARRRSPSAGSAGTAGGRCAPATCSISAPERTPRSPTCSPMRSTRAAPTLTARLGARGRRRPARRARLLHRRRHRHVLRHRLARCTHHSSRTGVRLVGPTVEWARDDGGEAGLHPSNIHDTPYTVGAVDFTGDMPIVLGPDGPSLGGFVCPVTVISDDRWKLGQLAPGRPGPLRARRSRRGATRAVATRRRSRGRAARARRRRCSPASTVLATRAATATPAGHVPRAGRPRRARRVRADDPRLRPAPARARARRRGSRDAGRLGRRRARRRASARCRCSSTGRAHARLGRARCSPAPRTSSRRSTTCVVDSRTVHLPLSWDDPATREAIERYMRVGARRRAVVPVEHRVHPPHQRARHRPTTCATSCSTPSTSCSASATCTSARRWRCRSTRATGSSPRSTTRPARGRRRTRSASAARTCASTAWRAPAGTSSSAARCRCGAPTGGRGTRPREEPWLLRCFDRIRWYPVEADELLELRADANAGRLDLRIDDGRSRAPSTVRSSPQHEPDIARFRAQREGAFADERARWEASGEFTRGERRARARRRRGRARARRPPRRRVRDRSATARQRGALAGGRRRPDRARRRGRDARGDEDGVVR